MPRSNAFDADVAAANSNPTSVVTRLANGYFSRHPLHAMAALFVGFVLACSVAPAFELLREGL